MKFTYSWLKEYCSVNLPSAELVKLLTMHGLKVEAYQSLGNDTLFELEITANRPDCLGVIGIAREVAALTNQKLRLPLLKEKPAKRKSTPQKDLIKIETPDLCPAYLGRVIKGIKIDDSPRWLKERLEAVGLRPINNVVDITNYVMLECGQPLHAFDFNGLQGRQIIVRAARQGEKILTIDGKEHELTPEMLVIADARDPVALAGIMGGQETEVSEETTDIFLESAVFEPRNIRRTSRRLKLTSDSSYRFERGVSPSGMEWGSQRATALIKEIAGGQVVAQKLVANRKPTEKKIVLHLDRVYDLLGVVELEKSTIKRILKALGFIPVKEWRGNIELKKPLFRNDINEEVDIIEEIGRIYGYDKIAADPPVTIPKVLEKLSGEELLAQVRDWLVSLGCFEALTNSFIDEEHLSDFPFWCALPADKALILANTKFRLRNNLASALLTALRLNEAYQRDAHIKLFEIAQIYYKDDESLPYEKFCLGLVDNHGLLTLKGTIETLLQRLKLVGQVKYETIDLAWFKPDRSIRLRLGNEVLGYLGELNAGLMDKYQTSDQVALAELDWELLVKHTDLSIGFREFPRLPAIRRDLAIVVDERIRWAEIEEEILKTGGSYLEKLSFFDLYRGNQIPAGKKSIACSLLFRSPDRTLTNEEVDITINKIVVGLGSNLAATLRS